MPETPDMEDLARRYMDLCQEHLNTLAGNQDTTHLRAQTLAMMTSGAQAFANAPGASFGPTQEGGDDRFPDRPPSTAASNDDSGPNLDELRRRIAALEERVAELKSGTSECGIASGEGYRGNES